MSVDERGSAQAQARRSACGAAATQWKLRHGSNATKARALPELRRTLRCCPKCDGSLGAAHNTTETWATKMRPKREPSPEYDRGLCRAQNTTPLAARTQRVRRCYCGRSNQPPGPHSRLSSPNRRAMKLSAASAAVTSNIDIFLVPPLRGYHYSVFGTYQAFDDCHRKR